MIKAIVVDDSPSNRRMLAKMLEQFDIVGIEIENGVQALTFLESNSDVEIAFVDWNMPLMSGIDFLREVRATKDLESLKFVMVTTNVEMRHIIEALREGVDEYIMLPLSRMVLEEKLALLGIRGARKLELVRE